MCQHQRQKLEQNPYVERLVGSIRRECVDHVIVLNEAHLRRILSEYSAYYHEDRTRLALERNAPTPRPIEGRNAGRVVATPRVGGLHHRYRRAASRTLSRPSRSRSMGMVSTDHAQTGDTGRQRRPNSNRVMPPRRFSHVGALDPAASVSDSADPSSSIGSGWGFREGQETPGTRR